MTKRLIASLWLIVWALASCEFWFSSSVRNSNKAQIDEVMVKTARDMELVEKYDCQVIAATPTADVQAADHWHYRRRAWSHHSWLPRLPFPMLKILHLR